MSRRARRRSQRNNEQQFGDKSANTTDRITGRMPVELWQDFHKPPDTLRHACATYADAVAILQPLRDSRHITVPMLQRMRELFEQAIATEQQLRKQCTQLLGENNRLRDLAGRKRICE